MVDRKAEEAPIAVFYRRRRQRSEAPSWTPRSRSRSAGRALATMPSRTAVLALAALAALGLTTGCEKPSPYVTLTAHGVTVKARAQRYCRSGKCSTGSDVPVLFVQPGDILGIDVPRSVAHDGWRIGAHKDGAYVRDRLH